MKIAVTGCSGYIGECFAKISLAAGHEIVALSRRAPRSARVTWVPYDLSSDHVVILPIDTDVVFHLAISSSLDTASDGVLDELSAGMLIGAAEEVGAKFVFVSSQTSRPDAPTSYGRVKWAIEQRVLASNGKVIRPGQVYGGKPRGLFGELIKTVQRTLVLPAFLPAPRVQPVHVEDLAYGMLKIVDNFDGCPGIVHLGSRESVTFTAFLRSIVGDRLQSSRIFVPVPSFLVGIAVRVLGKRTRFYRLMSLFELPPMDTANDLRSIGLTLRPLQSGMHLSGSSTRRMLFLEGGALLSYVMKRSPGSSMLRNYVSVIENLRGGRAIGLPTHFVRFPLLLAILDREVAVSPLWMAEFVWRLNAASVLAEASTFGAHRFLGIGQDGGFVTASLELTRAVLSEALWRMLSMLLRPLTRLVLPLTSVNGR